MSDAAPERYFYHSFPRRSLDSSNEIEKGCKILSLIRDSGLVMAPEIVTWQYEHADGSLPRTTETLQRRVCFTELAPHELYEHAKKFGSFALEFEVPVLKSLGAVPVFYIPRALAKAVGAEGTASTLVMQFIDAMVLIERMVAVQDALQRSGQKTGTFPCTFGFEKTGLKTFEVEAGPTGQILEALAHSLTPVSMLMDAMRAMTNFFYPADDTGHDDALAYYREREWRIAGALVLRGEDMMGSPGPNLIRRLLEIDKEFFGRELPQGSNKSRAEQSFVLPGLGDKQIMQMVHRIIVPGKAVEEAQKIMSSVKGAPSIATLETLT